LELGNIGNITKTQYQSNSMKSGFKVFPSSESESEYNDENEKVTGKGIALVG
jgi:hypothetical protein